MIIKNLLPDLFWYLVLVQGLVQMTLAREPRGRLRVHCPELKCFPGQSAGRRIWLPRIARSREVNTEYQLENGTQRLL